MCRVLKVSRSGYYDWQQRLPSPQPLRLHRDFLQPRKESLHPGTTYHPTNSSSTYPQSPLEGVRFSQGVSNLIRREDGDAKTYSSAHSPPESALGS